MCLYENWLCSYPVASFAQSHRNQQSSSGTLNSTCKGFLPPQHEPQSTVLHVEEGFLPTVPLYHERMLQFLQWPFSDSFFVSQQNRYSYQNFTVMQNVIRYYPRCVLIMRTLNSDTISAIPLCLLSRVCFCHIFDLLLPCVDYKERCCFVTRMCNVPRQVLDHCQNDSRI